MCFAGQQGADLRVGDRKLCGSAQVRRAGAVLQHGSILLERLPFDETDLLNLGPGTPAITREGLRAATVTLGELGGPTDPRVVGEAVVEGFRTTLDLDLSRWGSAELLSPRVPGVASVTGRGTLDGMRCRQCGHQNESGANFCSSCGSPLPHDDETTLSLTELAERLELDEELGAALAELPEGMGMLVVRRGPNAGSRFVLDAEVTALGRHPDSDIFLDDITVSRRHAAVRRLADGYEVADVGSLNGTYVDHKRVDTAPLHHLADLQIGRFVLVFLVGSDAE